MPRRTLSVPVKAQLLALGVPPAKHTPDGLAALFPREFNIDATDLSAEELARVLIYFASHGILKVSGTGSGTSIRNVEPGWHFCQFYRDVAQLLDLVAPYIAEGLRNGEGCFWVFPTSVKSDVARGALSRVLKDVDAYLHSGQLELMSHPDWYLDRAGRLKSFEDIAGALLQKQDQALAKGFRFLRAAGDAGWVSGTEQSKDFIDYEMKVNAAIGSTKIAAICTFRADVSADELVHIVTAHQDALHKTPA